MTDTTSPIELRQRHFFERREFFLEPDRIRLFAKNLNGEVETFVNYTHLTQSMRKATQQDGFIFVSAISLGLFALVGFGLNFLGVPALMRWSPLWAIASIIFWGFHFARRRRYLIVDLIDGDTILFLADNPSKEKLQAFLESMQTMKKEYIRREYFTPVDPDADPDDELDRYQWMLNQGIISEEEFEKAKLVISGHSEEKQQD